MSVENLMEKKQLDFNQPLLSVRRFSSTASTKEAKIKRKSDGAPSKIPPPPVYKPELKSGPLRNPGTVPFVWERSPGRPKDESKPQTRALQRPPAAPKLPPGRILDAQQQASAKREAIKDASSSGSEGGDEAYADALDILSRSESFFLNCSISGVSGLDGPDLKPSGAFFTDHHGQDFMMARFLPAAKAMASETPPCFTRKQPCRARATETNGQGISPKNIPNYAQADSVEDSEDEDHDSDGPDHPSLKLCGLLPQLCSQNSLCFMNPVLGMRKQGQEPISSVFTTKFGSSNAASRNVTARERQRNAMHEKRESIKFACKTENKRPDESSARKGWHSKVASPNDSQFPRSVHEEQRCAEAPDKCRNSGASDFIPCEKGSTIFRELLANESIEWESASAVSVAEKTLYIDSMHTSSILDSKHLSAVGEKTKLRPDNLESVDSCFLSLSDKSIHDVHIGVMDGSRQDEDNLQVSNTLISPKVDKDGKVDLESRSDNKLGSFESSHVCTQDSSGEVAGDGKVDLESQLCRKLRNEESSAGCNTQLLLPPPLPKSPSESWLKRTLPILSSRNSSSRSPLGMHLHSRVQASKTLSIDPKWETIVRTTKRTARAFALFRGIAYTNTRNLEDKVPHESEGSGICFARVSTVIGLDVLRNNCHVHTFLSQVLLQFSLRGYI
ncbi:hypothetical protein OIU77_010876 [Salix suchowensis]|uniref:Uncharacterized protein n=1 Tax=Salix suchowensis TaxID=1278906 RepID=A0ABQ9AC33_9ROSI|nr:hypothetical protein OIU77_010876 [Salix suchowensis]